MTRAFIVGNGPSLAHTNLDLLVGEVSFATNRISLIYDKTDWRPTHYVRSEGPELMGLPHYSLWEDDIRYHVGNPDIEVWCNFHFLQYVDIEGGNTSGLKTCTHYLSQFDDPYSPFMWHLPYICSYGSSVHVAMQIAVTKGYGPLYLIGCDLGYSDKSPSHFTEEYEVGYEDMLQPATAANLNMLNAHMIALRSSPVPIYNATIGGSLEVYKRVDYESLFRGG